MQKIDLKFYNSLTECLICPDHINKNFKRFNTMIHHFFEAKNCSNCSSFNFRKYYDNENIIIPSNYTIYYIKNNGSCRISYANNNTYLEFNCRNDKNYFKKIKDNYFLSYDDLTKYMEDIVFE